MIDLSLSSPNLEQLAAQLAETSQFNETLPQTIEIDYLEQPVTPDWAQRVASADKVFEAVWEDERRLAVYKGLVVELTVPVSAQPAPIIEWLSELDFELASFLSLHRSWGAIDPEYVPPTFANRHRNHGPFAAIKGAGHQRIISDRWLDYCSIKLFRSGALSFVQFHDLDADAALSLQQAKPGHLAVSSSPEGGFIKDGYLLRNQFNGVLDEARHVLMVPILSRAVSPREMLDACATRGEVNGRTIENVAFVFIEEKAAADHLHPLWLRGLECWTVREGREVRLDDAYSPPPPEPPSWAR